MKKKPAIVDYESKIKEANDALSSWNIRQAEVIATCKLN